MTLRHTILLTCLAIAATFSIARSDDKPAKPSPADQAAMAEAYMKAAAPGPEHARLKEIAGDWDADVKLSQPDGSTAARLAAAIAEAVGPA